jgi:hypothetical protein
MQDMWHKTAFSQVLQGVLHRGKIQLLDVGLSSSRRKQQQNVCILNYTILIFQIK